MIRSATANGKKIVQNLLNNFHSVLMNMNVVVMKFKNGPINLFSHWMYVYENMKFCGGSKWGRERGNERREISPSPLPLSTMFVGNF